MALVGVLGRVPPLCRHALLGKFIRIFLTRPPAVVEAAEGTSMLSEPIVAVGVTGLAHAILLRTSCTP